MIRAVILFAFLASSASALFNFNKKAAAPVPKAAPAPPAPKGISALVGGETIEAQYLVGGSTASTFFDPLGLSEGKSDETLLWYRAAELKHARICMLAFAGLLVQPNFHWADPVFDSQLGYGALAKLYVERPEAVWQILTALAAIEVSTLFYKSDVGGDLNWDPLNYKAKYGLEDPEKLKDMQTKELKNGRLAMVGTFCLLLQEYQTGAGPYGQL